MNTASHLKSLSLSLLLSLSLILLPILSAFAQTNQPAPGGILTGQLRDGAQNEVMYAAVALIGQDSLIVHSAISSPEGDFQIDGVRTFDTQRFGLGLVWKFGDQQAKTKQRTSSALDDELNRIGG